MVRWRVGGGGGGGVVKEGWVRWRGGEVEGGRERGRGSSGGGVG